MKKLNFLTILLSALLVSGSVWGQVPPQPELLQRDSKSVQEWRVKISKQMPPKQTTKIRKSVTNSYEAKISGGIEYSTLSAAIAAAKDNDTILLLRNIEGNNFVIDKNITIDFQGDTLINYDDGVDFVFDIQANVTLKNGTIFDYGYCSVNGTSGSVCFKDMNIYSYGYVFYCYSVGSSCNITIDGGNYNGHYCILSYGGDIEIKDGTIYGYAYAIYLYSYTNGYWKSKITISGGTLSSDGGIVCAAYNGTTLVTGGKFYGSNASAYFVMGYAPTYVIKGGLYDSKDIEPDLAEGYTWKAVNEEGMYEVWDALVEIDGGNGYKSYQDAFNDVPNQGRICLVNNYTGSVEFNEDKEVYLSLRKYHIAGTLTVKSGIVHINGIDAAYITNIVEDGGQVDISGGTYSCDVANFLAAGYAIRPVSGGSRVGLSSIVGTDTKTDYWTIQEAIYDALDNVETTITIQKDFTVFETCTIPANKIIVFDLNGKSISCSAEAFDAFSMFHNRGNLTIMDSKDTLKNGNGGGSITSSSFRADKTVYPGYATNTIYNFNNLTVNSGTIATGIGSAAAFAIDNDAEDAEWHVSPKPSEVRLTINGGRVISLTPAFSIRMYLETPEEGKTNTDNVVIIKNAQVDKLWVQDGEIASESTGTLSLDNVTMKTIKIGYYGVSKNLNVSLKHVTIEEGAYLSLMDHTLDGRTYFVDSVRISSYTLNTPFKHLINGQFQFRDDVFIEYDIESRAREEYPESEGYYYTPREGLPGFVNVYRYAQAFLRDFLPNIKDGYYLRLMDGEDGANLWYEIVKLKATNPDLPEVSGLGHPWHQDTTWDSDSTNVVPKDTDAVLIDHNVYVENDSVATANSIVVASGDTLRIQSGGELHVGGAGINLEDETAEVIVEPDAILTVGAAGVIADSVQNIVIESSGDTTGIFLLNPDVVINTQPKGTVEMVAHVGKRNGNNVWHRFALPVVKLDAAWTKEPSRSTYLYEWSYTEKSWVLTEGGSLGMKPFFGYTISTDYPVENVKYTFIGNLLGNQGSNIDFTHIGYGYFGNSYTGHIYAQTLLNDVFELEGVEGTVWMWNTANQSYSGVSLEDYSGSAAEDLEDFEKNVSPMQTFILKLNSGDGTNMDIDYAAAIWGNPRYGLVDANAPSRKEKVQNDAYANIIITSANGNSDKVRLTESAKYSDEYENGIDAPKYMNSGSINLYVTADGGDFTSLYSNNLQGKRLTLKTLDEVSYTLTIGHVEGGKYAIKDLLTNKVVAMENNATYTFAAQPNTTMERFEIVEARQLPTSVDQVQDFKETNGIYSILGQYIGETSNWGMLPKGVYVVDGVKLVK